MAHEIDLRTGDFKENYIKKAGHIFRDLDIASRLELTDQNDQQLALMHFGIRIARTKLYTESIYFGNAYFKAFNRFAGILRYVNIINSDPIEKSKQQIAEIESEINEFIQGDYRNPEAKRRARLIELAINQLFAAATTHNSDPNAPTFIINDQFLDNDWAPRWKKEIHGK